LEHTPVYTIGKKNKKNEQYYDYLRKIAEVYFVDRGGDITFHGPGQLVIYPILNLSYWNKDLHLYLRALEEVVIIMLKNIILYQAEKPNIQVSGWVMKRFAPLALLAETG